MFIDRRHLLPRLQGFHCIFYRGAIVVDLIQFDCSNARSVSINNKSSFREKSCQLDKREGGKVEDRRMPFQREIKRREIHRKDIIALWRLFGAGDHGVNFVKRYGRHRRVE